jgi:TonB family protein
MNVNFKRPDRREIIIAVTMLAFLALVIVIIQRGRSRDPLRENQIALTAQSVHQGDDVFSRQDGAAAAYVSRPTEDRRPQTQSSKQRKTTPPERSSPISPINGSMMQARLIYKVDPVYPEAAKSFSLSDGVRLMVTIDEKGAVSDVRVINGNQVFAEAAIDAVGQWRYEPALINGIPSSVSFGVFISFHNETVRFDHQLSDFVEANHVVFASDNLSDMSVRADTFKSFGNPVSYQGREYYPVTPDMTAPVIQLDKSRIRQAVQAGLPDDYRLYDLFMSPISVNILLSETGSIDIIQYPGGGGSGSQKIPGLEKELMDNLRVQSPAAFDGKAIPSYIKLTIDVPDFIR